MIVHVRSYWAKMEEQQHAERRRPVSVSVAMAYHYRRELMPEKKTAPDLKRSRNSSDLLALDLTFSKKAGPALRAGCR